MQPGDTGLNLKSREMNGLLASLNYAEYLTGALWAAWTSMRSNRLARTFPHYRTCPHTRCGRKAQYDKTLK